MRGNPMRESGAVSAQYATSARLDARIALHARFTVAETPFYRWIFDALSLRAGARVLEVGCGAGSLWREEWRRMPEGVHITLTDLSRGMLDAARARLAECGALVARASAFAFLEADATALPFAVGTFDLVVANHMLYHVPDIARALSEMKRVLAPDGVFICATNCADNLRELWDICAEYDAAIRAPELSFTMENGADILRTAFQHVERRDYPSHLYVTDARALRDYVASMVGIGVGADAVRLDGLERSLAERIAREGGITIRKRSGLFRCR